MASRPDHLEGVQPGSADDSGIRCPECEYNLTGLTENRCPECGSPFDPQELRELLAGQWRPIPGWSDQPESSSVAAFFRVCWWTWFRPAEFARRFPWGHDPTAVAGFWFAVRLAVVGPFLVGSILISILSTMELGAAGAALIMSFVVGGFVCVGSLICEAGLVSLLKLAVRPKYNPTEFSWWDFVTFHGSFLVLSAYGSLLAFFLNPDRSGPPWANEVVALLTLFWWSFAVGRGLVIRTRPGFGRIVALALIPAIAAGTIWIFAVLPISCLSQLRD